MLFAYAAQRLRPSSCRPCWAVGTRSRRCARTQYDGSVGASYRMQSSGTLHAFYKDQVDCGAITYDPVQVRVLHHLDELYDELVAYEGPNQSAPSSTPSGGTSWWQRFTGQAAPAPAPASQLAAMNSAPRGIYMHGGVGCGKTFMMDLLYEQVPLEQKKRVHFHHFMLDIHKRMHLLRQKGYHEDPLPLIVDDLLEEGWLLCFDEFQVTDVADALILRRLFSALLSRGFVMIATSNRPPKDLYKNGLQRDLFLPFIDLLSDRCSILSLEDSSTDYRALKGEHHAADLYLAPLSQDARVAFHQEFLRYAQGKHISATHVTTQGRQVKVPMAAVESGVCQFSFQDLCGQPLGAADYLAIAEAFPVVFVRDIPQLDLNTINQTRRFITFVDCMYDKHVRLHCLAAKYPEALFEVEGSQKDRIDEVFAFDRTVSRLLEMSSREYLNANGRSPKEQLRLGSPRGVGGEENEAAFV